jgi:Arc/MetJ-type ribon-helix-helix transcriptional regulator
MKLGQEVVSFVVRIPPDMHDELRVESYVHRVSMASIVRDALRLWFDQNREKEE